MKKLNIKGIVKQKEPEIKSLLKKLVALNTSNPPGNEYRAALLIKNILKKNKIPFRSYHKDKKRPNLVAELGKGKTSVLIACHMDTVPAGEGWTINPFKAKEKGKRIYGRGTSDNKGALASSLIAALILKKHEDLLKKRFIFAFVSDEEQGNTLGMDLLLKRRAIKADFAIIPDIGGDLDVIDIGEKGMLNIEVTSLGKQAHSSRPEVGENALVHLAEFVTLLKKHRMGYRKDKLFTPPTLVPSIISAGSAPNIVPGRATLTINIRYLPDQKHKKIVADLKKLSKKVKKGRFSFKKLVHLPPHKLRVSKEIKDLRKAMRKVTGKLPKLKGISGATFAKPLNLRDVKAVAIGSSPSHIHHMADEYIEVKQLTNLTHMICHYALN